MAQQQQVGTAEALPQWDEVRGLCAPLQNSLNDIPVIMFNVEGNAKGFKKFSRRRMDRALSLAPFVYYGRPVAPRAYRMDVHSHHIVRAKKASDPRHVIDYLISDVNQYYKGFRVGTLDAERKYQWSHWFRFKDFPLPSFLGMDGVNIQIMSLDGGHSHPLAVGGKTAMVNMFESYVKHSMGTLESGELGKITGRTILVFCETMRFWSVYWGVVHAIQRNPSEVIPVGRKSKHRIGSWKVMCRFALKIGRRGGGVVFPDDLELVALYGITKFRQLIAAGDKGELRLLLWDDDALLVGAVQAALHNPDAHRAANVPFLE